MKRSGMKTAKITLLGMLFAAAMALSFLESMLLSSAVLPPGMRLGLSNIVTMYALFSLGKKEGLSVAVLKSLFVLMTRGAVAASMSFAGGIISIVMMIAISKLFSADKNYVLLSVCGGIAHNVGQLIVAYFMLGDAMLYYAPLLMLSGAAMGTVTGVVLRVVMPHINRLNI